MNNRIALIPILFRLLLSFFRTSVLSRSYRGELPPLTPGEEKLKKSLYQHIFHLSQTIGERNVLKYQNLIASADYMATSLSAMGYDVRFQEYMAGGRLCRNIEAEIIGGERPGEIIIIGAHYDTVPGSPGANDNGSGIASLLEMAAGVDRKPGCTIRFVAFVNEESPFAHSDEMGSLVYARRSRKRNEQIICMFSLETMGSYSSLKGSQKLSFPLNLFYPDKGDFIAFVSNDASGEMLLRTLGLFRKQAEFPSEGGIIPEIVPGVTWSDHWSFWQVGYPALMITDTAPFRYEHYHTPEDTVEKIQYDNLARVVSGLVRVIDILSSS